MTKLRPILNISLILLSLSFLFSPVGCAVKPTLEKFEDTRNMMDTFVTISVYTPDKATADKAISAAFDRMQEIVNAASIYDENAEAYRLNRDGYIDNPSADLLNLTRLSIDYFKLTNSYFDITVQPLLDIWSAGLWQQAPDV